MNNASRPVSANPRPAPATGSAPKPSRKPGDSARRASMLSARSRARSFALQAIYQHLVGQQNADQIDAFTRDLSGFNKADSVHFDALLHGCVTRADELDALILPLLDRPWTEISPIEHGVMWIGAYEFLCCPDVPWRVVINECVELSKDFGGTDGHKYVNGILNGLAHQLRALEVQADRSPRR